MTSPAKKAAQVRRLLKSGAVEVVVNPRMPGVVLPGYLLGREQAVLAFAEGDPADLRVTKAGITATLTFSRRGRWSRRLGRRKARRVACVLPWEAVAEVAPRLCPEKPAAPAPKPEPWRPPPAKAFAGAWHWDEARSSIDAVIASLPEDAFSARLDSIDTRSRADSTLVYRWGVELGKLWGLPDPCAYGSALTDSTAIHRPSQYTREDRAAGVPDMPPTAEQENLWRGMVDRERILRGLTTSDERVPTEAGP